MTQHRYVFDDCCPNCHSEQIDKMEVDNSGGWAANYECFDCDIQFSVNFEDRMGSQVGDLIRLNHHYAGLENEP